MIDSEYVLACAVLELITQRGGELTIADIGHLFGSTAVDEDWERLVPTWCDPPLTLYQLEALIWPTVHERVDQLPLRPGVADLLNAAKEQDWRVALATGHAPDRLQGRLERLGVLPQFDAVVLAGEVRRGKPAPDVFLEAAERIGVHPTECVVVEDSFPGCQAAIAAGMAVIICPSRVTAHLDFPTSAHRVSSLAEVCLDDVASLLRTRQST
jgi:HAD superfamily hydrolase (TIGR01509 family)